MAITMLQSENGEYKKIRAFLSRISGKLLFSSHAEDDAGVFYFL